jgi:hypothetical protein
MVYSVLTQLQYVNLIFMDSCIVDGKGKGKGKGKVIPLKAWTGPEGSRRLRLPNFNTIGT